MAQHAHYPANDGGPRALGPSTEAAFGTSQARRTTVAQLLEEHGLTIDYDHVREYICVRDQSGDRYEALASLVHQYLRTGKPREESLARVIAKHVREDY